MIVGIDARAAAEVPAGRGRYVRELLRALSALPDDGTRYVLYCRRPAELGLNPARFRWREIPLPDPAWHLATAARASRACDVLLSTNSYLTAWFATVPTAVVVFDLIAFVRSAEAQARARRIEHATLAPAVRRAAALLCISEATRRDLVARHPTAAAKAVVTPLAPSPALAAPADQERVRAKHGLHRPFVLAAGTVEPRKNLVGLMDAWAGLEGEAELVLVGPPGWEMDAIVRRARADRVRMLGFVPDAELAALYGLCAVFAYPSLYEGFGLPVLEAMACGAPVVTSDRSSLPEVAGDAAVLVDPQDPAALRAALARLLADPGERARLAAVGRARAATFTWERTARETLEALRRVAYP